MSLEYILLSLGISLFLTLALELAFALVFKVRGKALLIVALVNVLTNPAVVILHLLLCRHFSLPEIAVVSILEIFAVIAEAAVYKARCTSIKRTFLFSLGANAFSYLCGVLIDTFI